MCTYSLWGSKFWIFEQKKMQVRWGFIQILSLTNYLWTFWPLPKRSKMCWVTLPSTYVHVLCTSTSTATAVPMVTVLVQYKICTSTVLQSTVIVHLYCTIPGTIKVLYKYCTTYWTAMYIPYWYYRTVWYQLFLIL